MKPDEQRMRDVLVDTIRLLCRTGIEYSRRLRVQGLLGITVDDGHVFLIHVDDFIARNCADIEDKLCGFAEECKPAAGVGHVTSDVAVAQAGDGSHNPFTDLRSNSMCQQKFGPLAKYPNRLSLDQQAHNDILTSVAMSEISSVVAASAEARDLSSLQLSSHSGQNVPFREDNLPTLNSDSSSESCDQLTSNGNDAAADSAPSISQSSVPNETEADNRSRPPPIVLKMETDAGEENASDGVVLAPHSELSARLTLCTAAVASEHRHGPSHVDDVDSSSADTNEDGYSERTTSESEDVADHASVARLDQVSSLPCDPRALVGNVLRWQVGNLQQRSAGDGAADAVSIPPAVLTGVVQTGGSHVSAYYQQQVAFFSLYFTTIYVSMFLPSVL